MTEDLLTVDSDLLMDDLFIKPIKKNKILMISDHPLAPSGVGIQSRFLIEGLIKTGRFSFRCIGGAIKHQDYRTIKVNDDFIVKPVDGFGNHDMIRQLLVTEKPDALIIFTDPRQFIWLWEIEDEIHQLCPIAYWHVWDNDPYPAYNKPFYDSTDLINCLSYKTYDLVKPNYPEKTHYVPHTFPKSTYFEFKPEDRKALLEQNFGPQADWFKALWVNRNATRKLPADVLDAWRLFLDDLEEKHGHRKAMLIMHTDPKDPEGPDLLAVTEALGLQGNVLFSTDKLQFDKMNTLYNLCDTVVNVAKNEGFGLSTLISMQVGKPVIALKTGGETSKVVDYRDGSEHGVAIEPIKRSMVGSQMVPYIYEDYAGTDDLKNAFMTVYEYTPEERKALAEKCKAYVDLEFDYDKMIEKWDKTLTKTIEDFKENGAKRRWELMSINPGMVTFENSKLAEATTDTTPVVPGGKKRPSDGNKKKVVKKKSSNVVIADELVKPKTTKRKKTSSRVKSKSKKVKQNRARK